LKQKIVVQNILISVVLKPLKNKPVRIANILSKGVRTLEKPILFNTEMVKAILKGRKTATRRIIKPQPLKPVPMGFVIAAGHNSDIEKFCFGDSETGGHNTEYFKPPYAVGDTLWVRETWAIKDGHYFYKAGHELLLDNKPFIDKWKPSIHMPRSAARIF
jgi:hypothetical protein